jgi:protein TonB
MAYAQSSTFSPRRAAVFLLIVALHVGFVWVLNAGLAQQAVERVFGPIETKMIEETKEDKKEPPPPPPKMEIAPPPFVPPPEVAIELAPETTTSSAITATTKAPPKVAPPPPIVKSERSPATRIAKRDGSDNPEYPPQSKRLGEEGLCILTITVTESGRVENVILKQSSGFPRLDEAAIKHLQRQGWKFKPAMENGKPVASTLDVPVRWKITVEKG